MDLLPIDFPLPPYINLTPQPTIPFSIYLKQAATSKHKKALFQPYTRLPVELQLKILESCDAPTTFRLMQTSSGIRKAAMKLFWSHADPWYYISSTDIEVTEEHAPDSVYWDSQFVKQIEQVEIGFEIESAPPTQAFSRTTVQSPRSDNAEQFRVSFQRGFPSAKRIIISLMDVTWMQPPTWIPRALDTIARAFTPHYTVFIALPSRSVGSGRCCRVPKDLFQLNRASQWNLTRKAWKQGSILPPMENLTGIVGIYVQVGWRALEVLRESATMANLRHELYEKYHFSGPEQIPFACPRNNCNKEFKTALEWRDHMNDYFCQDHDARVDRRTDSLLDYTSRLPTEVEDALIAKELEIYKARKRSVYEMNQLAESYGEQGSEQRRLYEEQFLTQLKHDPACKSQDNPQGSILFRELQWGWDRRDETVVKGGIQGR